MNRSLAVLIVFALILAACQSAATPAPAPQPQQPAIAKPTEPPKPAQPPAAPAPLPTMRATGALPELRPPRSGGQLNPPTLAPTTSSRPIAGTANRQTYRDNNLGLSFQFPAGWRSSITSGPSAPNGIVQQIDLAPRGQISGLKISIIIRQSQGDLLAWLKKELSTGSLLTSTATIEGGIDNVKNYNARAAGYPAIFISGSLPAPGTPTFAHVYVADNQTLYQIIYSSAVPENLTHRAIYLQMLDTLSLSRTTTPGLTLPNTSFTTGVITSTVVP